MSNEKVLFEMRVDADGTHIYESNEWQAYHTQWRGFKRRGKRGESFRQWWNPEANKQAIRQSLDSLQNLYDDLYGQSVQNESNAS